MAYPNRHEHRYHFRDRPFRAPCTSVKPKCPGSPREVRFRSRPVRRDKIAPMALGSSDGSPNILPEAPRFPDRPDLTSGDVHVVRICLDVPIAGATQLLDDDERRRASRFVFERDRRRFTIAHAWVRILLGRCLAQTPESLRFVVGPYGKPAVAEAPIDLRFNLSHAGERAFVALALGRDVGVDIDEERPLDVLELANRFFAPAESAALRGMPPSEQTRAFFRCWTRKEAFIKALRLGLSFPLRQFEVSMTDDDSAQLLRSCSAAPNMLGCWQIAQLASESGHAAALAATAGNWRVVRWETPRWPPSATRRAEPSDGLLAIADR